MRNARRGLLLDGAALVAFFAAAILLQFLSGAYKSEFGAHPDEPAHVVTSLLIRDYLASGFTQAPMRYAESYYAHYPKAALGHWPPVYYAAQAVWNLIFPATRASILACHAMFTALLAALLFHCARRRFAAPVALAAGFWLLSEPMIQWLNSAVMLDIAVALFALAAVLAFADYLHAPGWRAAAWFGWWSILAILTKGTGMVLALLPLAGVLLARRAGLMARGSFWLPALLVLAVCGPWYWFAPEALQQRTGAFGAPAFDAAYCFMLLRLWMDRLGAPLLLFAALGIAAGGRAFRLQSRDDARWVAAVAFLCSALLFLLVMRSAFEERNLAILMAPLFLFATAGIVRLVEWLPIRRNASRWRVALAIAILAVLSGANAARMPRKTPAGYAQAAADLAWAPPFRDSVFLVSGDSTEEGMFISEMALAERRPGHIVLRASKQLSHSDWAGGEYSSDHDSVEDIEARLKEVPVGVLVLQRKPARARLHHDLLSRMVASQPGAWRLLETYPRSAAGNGAAPGFLVYELVGHQTMPRGGVRVRLSDKLGRDVEP
jgi:hypothetical protein